MKRANRMILWFFSLFLLAVGGAIVASLALAGVSLHLLDLICSTVALGILLVALGSAITIAIAQIRAEDHARQEDRR